MRRMCFLAATAALTLLATNAWAEPQPVTVAYDATQVAAERWQYTYTVSNVSLAVPVDEFTIWFRQDWYANLALATPDPPAAAWNEIVTQPDPLLHDAGFYDALRKTAGIPLGGAVSGFAVQFDWLGSGTPGTQPFDITDAVTFQPIYSGTTLPEPATAGMLGVIAALALCRRR